MIKNYINNTYVKTATLAVFRFFFGFLMLFSIIRFWSKGWIQTIYIDPKWHFSYYGFEFVQPLGHYTYVLFVVCAFSAIAIALGFYFRIASILFFLSFTYIELIDKTTYLNHYYFVSVISFVLIFLPAHVNFSLDALRKPSIRMQYVPRWTIDILKLILCIVYFYAGLAKINSDWLLEALPLKLWLSNKMQTPIIGSLFLYKWSYYFFSWSGMLYDLCIPFLLLYKPTRKLAFVAVLVFHFLTHILFPAIGMFPLIMTFAVFIFFDVSFQEKVLNVIHKFFPFLKNFQGGNYQYSKFSGKIIVCFLAGFMIIQVLLPWRYLCYPGELFWTEEGYRFSWRVMLIEKAGHATFKIVDPDDGKSFFIQNEDFLTDFQIKQMATQPDFILQYAHKLRDHYISEGIGNPEVYVDSYVTLNRRLSQPFIDPNINLAKEKDSFATKKWILPFNDTIKGL